MRIFAVAGPMACGKSTYADTIDNAMISDHLVTSRLVPEPFNPINLESALSGRMNWASYQLDVIQMFDLAATELEDSDPVEACIWDTSIIDVWMYVLHRRNRGDITAEDADSLGAAINDTVLRHPSLLPTCIIRLETPDIQTQVYRIRLRDRAGEGVVDEDFLKQIDCVYEDHFIKSAAAFGIPVITLDTLKIPPHHELVTKWSSDILIPEFF